METTTEWWAWAEYASVAGSAALATTITQLAKVFGLPSKYAKRFVVVSGILLFTTAVGLQTGWQDVASIVVAFLFVGPTVGLAAIAAYDSGGRQVFEAINFEPSN